MEFETVIGLEIHAQLLTSTKIFCTCSSSFGAEQNTHACPVCLGMPGVLPVLNKKVVEYAIKMGLATNCKIASRSIFARKNYFYPDLPKGYQISQFEEPICEYGHVDIIVEGEPRRIRLTRIHMEEDAGKSIHAEEFVASDETLVDVNRCGTPLIEIVTEPDIRSPREAFVFLNELRQILRYLNICDGNMEEGSLRCDANISIRPKGDTKLGTKAELKNMNSFRGVEKAIEYEVLRQTDIITSGGKVQQQTLLWDDKRMEVQPIRSKEMAHDYRYFPDPDLVPVDVAPEWIEAIRADMPELPAARRERFRTQFKLPEYDAAVLTETKDVADYFEAVAAHIDDAKLVSNWIMGEVLRTLNEQKLDIADFPINPQRLAGLVDLIQKSVISGKIAKSVFTEMLTSTDSAQQIVDAKGLTQVSDSSELDQVINDIITANPDAVERFKAGETKLTGFFVGQIMKATQGKANPKVVNQLLMEKLNKK
ncbi:Asp-tRNA(Asn)/Glu-tRNA(Gln) amidotransferase subunit GatB [candidate division KSB1 bacterium]|nr:Asp-tRNA(Asn)/Glu-tRNA(Gln) amidotransferase subunit GatB [candidate division KSB1 bacterium]